MRNNRVDLEDELQPVTVMWSEKYACPIYVLENGKRYIEATGEYAGYFDEVVNDIANTKASRKLAQGQPPKTRGK